MDIKVMIATHKPYWMPKDTMYYPIQVGGNERICPNWLWDNTGENISDRNTCWCELTGLYWAWKNTSSDYLGLVHYRRHFTTGWSLHRKRQRVLTCAQLKSVLQHVDVVLPKARHYWIETNYSQYVHAHHAVDLQETRKIISERYGSYLPVYDEVMARKTGHRFNMFIMCREHANAYCTWLFDILFELEERLDLSAYSKNDARVFGFVAERLLDVWILGNKIQYQELPCLYMEHQNWLRKGMNFICRKITGSFDEWRQQA